ncbi:AfsR/SARP family transcriptional regulator [Streptomyces prasinus]|uniref:AfsR/SARP family transcriptional regulator n=1 Tax=Streptomyces prasinus TaxID=67345 RepID=UPI000A513EED|nr:AfsR/SARP family transcriptional regulator [Streptomyces prasinus]
MEIRILGPVGLCGPGEKASVMPERVRRFLAALAWRPNDFVADDAAVEQVWGDDLPRRPRDALYTCATRLRRAFVEHRLDAPCPVIRRAGGYVLMVDPGCVDLHRSRRLVSQARNAAREGDPVSAVALYDSALELWTGIPLSDLGSPWASAARIALEREWLANVIGRLRIDLQLGHHIENVPVLHQLAVDHPFDEVVAEMLMLALYRSGRQNEALGCFDLIRRRLVEQLGDEPGATLQELHRKVLCRDPSLELHHELVMF